MSKKWMALLALVFVTSACKKEDVGKETQTSSATPATETTAKGADETTPTEKAETTPTPDAPPARKPFERKKVDADRAKKQSESFRALLAKGRKEVKSGKFADGMASFEKALEIDPNNARALSELGWAAFKNKDLERAESATRASIRNSRENSVSGASLYNLGRIHEERGENDQAATAYTRSLEVRPGNKIVAQRLADLKAKGAKISEANKRCFFIEMSSKVPAPKDVCNAFWDETSRAAAASAGGATVECDAVQAPQKVGDVTVVTFAMRETEMNMIEEYVAILKKDKWYAHNFNTYDVLGVSYNGQEGFFGKVEAKELHGGGAPELVLPYEFNFYDGDYSDNTVETYNEAVTQVISLDGAKPTMLGVFYTSRKSESGPWLDDMPSDAKDEVHFDQRSTLTFADGKAKLAATDGKKSANPEGTFTLGEAPLLCYAASEIDMF